MKEFRKEVQTLSSSAILVDESYQRKVKPNELRAIMKNYNPNVVNMPKVSFRDGKFYVFDGQHTIAALVALNGGKPVQIQCIVFYGMRQWDEKELFKLQTGCSSRPSAADKLRADYNSGEPEAVQMISLVERAGLNVSLNGNNNVTNNIVCISTLNKIFSQLSSGQFFDVLDIIKTAWGGNPDSLVNQMFSGMAKFVKTYEDYDKDNLIKKLRKVEPIAIVREAKGIGGASGTVARVILRIYNQGKCSRNKLQDKL